MKKNVKKDGAFMKKCVIAIFIIVPVYAFSHLVLSFIAGSEISPVTSSGFFLFFAGEAGILSYIKQNKRKQDEEGSIEHNGEVTDDHFSGDNVISD